MSHTIKRTILLGRIVVNFTSGPVYDQMLEELEQTTERFGSLVKRGETLTGDQWLKRIEGAHGRNDTAARAIATLMM